MTIKAVGLLSGGLDSTLAAKLMLEQNIEVYAVNFTSPFCTCTPKNSGCSSVATAIKQLGNIPLKHIAMRDEYLTMIQNPKHGHGKGMNPCIDCRIMKFKRAIIYMKEIGASFIFTGEVLGQRPMSQHRRAISIIDKESIAESIILRPLSAKHFPPTIPEIRGWVDRSRLLAITGRSRKEQIAIAQDKNINNYPCPAGGCLLTDKNFSERLRDYFLHTKKISCKDIALLKIGRHFRLEGGDKIIVARDERESDRLEILYNKTENFLFIPEDFSGPTVMLQGDKKEEAIQRIFQHTNAPLPSKVRIRCKHKDIEEFLILDV